MRRGFTLIEILVSVAVFAVVVVAGTTSVLSAIDANQKSQSLNSVMTNLNVALESMSREIRVGKGFQCTDGTVDDCSKIKFTPAVGPDDITYEFKLTSDNITYNITRQIGAALPESLTAPEVKITAGHFVINTITGQDKVFLAISGYAEARQQTRSTFYIQTLMSKRDVNPAN